MPKTRLRVIIDTNLWLSFLLTKNQQRLDALFADESILLLVSPELLDEIVEVARRPKFRKYFDLDDLTDLLLAMRRKAAVIDVTTNVADCRDAKDNFLLALALDGNATHLLTGDKDLLVLNPFGKTRILTITEFLSDR